MLHIIFSQPPLSAYHAINKYLIPMIASLIGWDILQVLEGASLIQTTSKSKIFFMIMRTN